MDFEIRSLEPPLDLEEIELLKKLEYDAFRKGGLDEFEIPAFSLFGKIFLFYFKGSLAGHAVITRYYEKEAAYIYSFAIVKEFQGKGLSYRFLKLLLERIKKEFPVVYLTVKPDNEPALKIYRKAGFHTVELLKDFYGKGEDRYLMMLVFKQVEVL